VVAVCDGVGGIPPEWESRHDSHADLDSFVGSSWVLDVLQYAGYMQCAGLPGSPLLDNQSLYTPLTLLVRCRSCCLLFSAQPAWCLCAAVQSLQVGLPLLGGSALSVYAALNIHTTLQYIGVLGVLLTIVNKALSYDSPQEALEDAKGAVSGAQKALSKLGSIKPPAIKAPSLPSLPKMPQAGGKPPAAAATGQPVTAGAMNGSSSNSGGGGGGSSAAGAAALSAAVAAGSSRGDAVDVGDETEQELVD